MCSYNMCIKIDNILKPLNSHSDVINLDVMIGATVESDDKEGFIRLEA